jgi:hypothetical protein
MCALYKACNGERAWREIEDRLQAPYYRSRLDLSWKIRTDVGKMSFVHRSIGYLKARLGLPSLKRMCSERGLGK